MPTTIQISDELRDALKKRKLHSKESYEGVIWDLIEDQLTLKDEIVVEIEKGLKEYREGKFISADEVFGE
jgi:predicted transcriptional regulator